jgi:hypothetical protein
MTPRADEMVLHESFEMLHTSLKDFAYGFDGLADGFTNDGLADGFNDGFREETLRLRSWTILYGVHVNRTREERALSINLL